MPVTIATHAREGGTIILPVYFTTEDGDGFTPNSINWKLTDDTGTVINGRSSVSLTANSSTSVVLTGDDLAITGTVRKIVKVKIFGTYNSDYGSNLTYREEATVVIDNLVSEG